MKNILVLILSLSIACSRATADQDRIETKNEGDIIQVGEIAYGGNGCPEGSIVVAGDAEKNALVLQFDQYTAAAGRGEGRIGRKSCNVAIPVTVPAGFQVGIVAADYRGYVSLSEGAQAQLLSEYFIAGSEGALYKESYLGEISEEVNIHHESPDGAILWSPCGTDANLRINTSLLVQANQLDEEAVVSLDQASLIQLVLRQCEVEPPPSVEVNLTPVSL